MKKIELLLPLAMFFLLTMACNFKNANPTAKMQEPKAPAEEIEDVAAKGVYENVETDKFSELIEKGDAVLIDVRTPDEYGEGHIDGAQLMDFFSKDLKAQIAQLDKDKTVLVYCRSGKRSSSAMMKMEAAGIKTVYNLSGGILKWIAEGGKVVK